MASRRLYGGIGVWLFGEIQYPTADDTMTQGRSRGSLYINRYIKTIVQQLDNVTPSSVKAHSTLNVAKAVSNLTSGSHNIVVVGSFPVGTIMSRYSAPIAKMGLYLYYDPEKQDDGTQGRWKAMRREVVEKPITLSGPPPPSPIVYLHTEAYSTEIETKTSIFLAPCVKRRIARYKARSQTRSRSPLPVPQSQGTPELTQHNGSSWRIIDFEINDWGISSCSIQQEGKKLSQIHALHQSMLQQYPVTEYVKAPLPIILEIYYQITSSRKEASPKKMAVPSSINLAKRIAIEPRYKAEKDKTDLQAVLDAWTDGNFMLAVGQQDKATGMMSAWRIVSPNENGAGKNVFLAYTPCAQKKSGAAQFGKWQAMNRR